MRSRSASASPTTPPSLMMPATLAIASRRPCSPTTPSTSASTAALSLTSHAVMPSPSSTSTRTTVAPASANASAHAAPMPRAAPVTIATRPSNRNPSTTLIVAPCCSSGRSHPALLMRAVAASNNVSYAPCSRSRAAITASWRPASNRLLGRDERVERMLGDRGAHRVGVGEERVGGAHLPRQPALVRLLRAHPPTREQQRGCFLRAHERGQEVAAARLRGEPERDERQPHSRRVRPSARCRSATASWRRCRPRRR